ncbi:sensor histidine kinase [Sphingomonas sp. LHG3443-2]|uniref:sensor histidine kinase n=1 Tax=Sphingomonas sp. LHG3443-2 TaxID=2804639 RepID=UPI003CE7F070
MLKRTPSLAFRASVVFMAVYGAIFLAVITISAITSHLDRGGGNHRGAVLALDYATADLRRTDTGWRLASSGNYRDLASRNPRSWLVVIDGNRVFTTGAVDSDVLQAAKRYQGSIDRVLFRLPGDDPRIGVGASAQKEFGRDMVLVAAGGIDPATLSRVESMHILLDPSVLLVLLVIAVISLVAMLVAAPFLARAVQPITREATFIGPDDPGGRLDEGKSPKELLPLVRSFNSALARLELELGRRKRFIADAAHELRTPLAVVSLRVETLDDERGKEDLRRGMSRLTHIVSQMLDLERLTLTSETRSRVDLVTISRDLVADLAPSAILAGYDLSLAAPEKPVFVTGDAHAISRALTNLISNSILHAGGAGEITITVRGNGSIDVTDEGPGVLAEVQPRLFEPFSRGNPSVEGCGLGLHLTREIMRAHQGDVRLIPTKRGATFRLSFVEG